MSAADDAASPAGEPTFTEDWFAHNIPHWRAFFGGAGWDPEAPKTAVEIGSFEGRSTVWMLENLLRHPDSRVHCLDTFEGGAEHRPDQVLGLYGRFRRNLEASGVWEKAVVRRGPSFEGLLALHAEGVSADLVYVDGSHEAPDVLADMVLGFRLLRPGGLMVCDDYLWKRDATETQDVLHSPKIAIDAFTTIHRKLIGFPFGLHNWQFGFRRLG